MAQDLVPTKVTSDQSRLVALARELATGMREQAAVLVDYGLTEAQYQVILQNPFFKNTLDICIIEWNSADSADKRVRLQAAAAIEDALPMLAARMSKESEPLNHAVETGKLLAKLAGIGEAQQGGPSAEKFTITINLGEDKKLEFTKDITPAIPAIANGTPHE